jgi:lipopolysaccharide export system permease protein
MAVISSSGQSPLDIVKILSNIIIPASLIVALFSLYITPSVTAYRYQLEHRLNNEERIEEITAGRFISSQSGKATFFVEDIVNNELSNVFFSSGKSDIISVENSKTASYYFDKDNRKYIMLKEGIINEIISPNGVETRTTKYEEHVLQLRQAIPLHINSIPAGKSTIDLFFSNETTDHAELQSRLLLPIASLILGFIAIPLSYSSPKKGRYSKIFLGAIIYFIYFISMSIAKKIYLLAYIPSFFGLWWIHILVMAMLIYVYYVDSHKIPARE